MTREKFRTRDYRQGPTQAKKSKAEQEGEDARERFRRLRAERG